MTTCFDCFRTLPYKCICAVSDEEKTREWFDLVKREITLIEAILSGHKPVIYIGDFSVPVTTKTYFGGATIRISCKINPKDWRKAKIFTLMDAEGKPLYRRSRKSIGMVVQMNDTIDMNWDLGAGIEVKEVEE